MGKRRRGFLIPFNALILHLIPCLITLPSSTETITRSHDILNLIKVQHIIDFNTVCMGIGITVESKRGRNVRRPETLLSVLVEGRSQACHSQAGYRYLTGAMCERRRYHPRQAVAAGRREAAGNREKNGKAVIWLILSLHILGRNTRSAITEARLLLRDVERAVGGAQRSKGNYGGCLYERER